MNRLLLGVVLAVAVGAAALFALWPSARPRIDATISVGEALASEDARYARALMPRRFVFPADHGPHPDFRTEWWYYTGNLQTASGRHFGFQLTFFRIALAPGIELAATVPGVAPSALAPRASAWATRQLYVAHFAVTDIGGGRFHAFSRNSRDALGLAGASASPYRVWLEHWSVEGDGSSARLHASEGDVAIDLVVSAAKPIVLQGDRGLSRKGPEPGNASFYYSISRMPARGTVRLGRDTFEVTGAAWMDREWSTSALGPDLAGWDWFALQLDDGRELMFYLLRRHDGAVDSFSGGTLVAHDGTTRPLGANDVRVETLAHWTSPRSGVRYPARWRLSVPSAALRFEIAPRLADQELIVGTRYWEGAVAVTGSAPDGGMAGQGYVELVGYAE